MIRVRDLRVDYDTVCAVRELSLTVGKGEVCGLIGPNGAGKTTTMRALLGLIEPTYGEIELAGVDMLERPQDASRLVGFMPDFPPLYDDLLVWEFLDLFAASYHIPKQKRKAAVASSLEQVGLVQKAGALVVELSRGMRQRLMLAKTLIPEPQVLILDEPASGVDPQGRIDLKNVIRAQAALGKTVLISSHILAEMSEFCTSVAIMQKGEMVISGKIDDVSARLMGGTMLAVDVLGPTEEFLRIVSSDQHSGPIEKKDGSFAFRYQGSREQAAELLARLVQSGVKVASFAPRKEGLEELFIMLGAKELS
jgi:ABC-2 type transport system ATP-binding protein